LGSKRHWTWCFQTALYSFFHIDRSRSSAVLRKLLGKRFRGILGADYYSAYLKYARLFGVRMQYCLAHLIREIRFLAEHSSPLLARWGRKLLKILKNMFKTLYAQANAPPERRLARLIQCQKAFLQQVRRPPNHSLAEILSRRFRGNRMADYFRFVTDPNVETTNNGTERAIRHIVIDRKVTQGTRNATGMRWCERSWTTIATCQKQNRNVLQFLHQILLAHWSNKPIPALC
jgi:transposase